MTHNQSPLKCYQHADTQEKYLKGLKNIVLIETGGSAPFFFLLVFSFCFVFSVLVGVSLRELISISRSHPCKNSFKRNSIRLQLFSV